MDEVVETIRQHKIFTKFDLASGFHQLPVKKEHQKFTAFAVPNGLFQFFC